MRIYGNKMLQLIPYLGKKPKRLTRDGMLLRFRHLEDRPCYRGVRACQSPNQSPIHREGSQTLMVEQLDYLMEASRTRTGPPRLLLPNRFPV